MWRGQLLGVCRKGQQRVGTRRAIRRVRGSRTCHKYLLMSHIFCRLPVDEFCKPELHAGGCEQQAHTTCSVFARPEAHLPVAASLGASRQNAMQLLRVAAEHASEAHDAWAQPSAPGSDGPPTAEVLLPYVAAIASSSGCALEAPSPGASSPSGQFGSQVILPDLCAPSSRERCATSPLLVPRRDGARQGEQVGLCPRLCAHTS